MTNLINIPILTRKVKNNLPKFIKTGLAVVATLLLTAIITDKVTNGALNQALAGQSIFSSSSSLFMEKQLPIYCVKTDKKQIALTFDGAWGNEDTATLLEILERQNVTATFFFTGGWISSFPEDVKTILAKGHEVGNHSENHKQMSTLSKEQCKEEIQIVHDKVRELTGLEMTVFRPPFGDYDDTVIQAANELGYHVIQWDVDSLDWKDYGVDSIIHTVTEHKHLGNGSIILMHNGAKYTKDALEEMIIRLKEQGYEFVTVSELIYPENYKMDHEGRQYVDGLTCPPQAEATPAPSGTLREY
ncbi:MAG: polysaccharide deacetylase family protein [Lachnospiraceae bacterium]|nr:polysaccharide deacetylase family protein [Lachnospiraceae bacterium]